MALSFLLWNERSNTLRASDQPSSLADGETVIMHRIYRQAGCYKPLIKEN
jgi:hypothetical protein